MPENDNSAKDLQNACECSPVVAYRRRFVCWSMLLLAILLAFQPLLSQSNQGIPLPKSTQEQEEMVQLLREIGSTGDPLANYHWNARRAAFFKAQLKTVSDQDRLAVAYLHSLESMNAGDEITCIKQVKGYLDHFKRPYSDILNDQNQPLFELLALAYLRQGENENCQAAHSPASCILPLQAAGIHQLKTGSRNAKDLYALLLDRYPSDKYTWLYNLAAMTLGEYPDQVDKAFLVPFPNWQHEQADFPSFPEIATKVGLAENSLLGGASLEDFNNDGLLDVFATSHGVNDQARLFLNDGKGGFTDVSAQAGLTGIVSGFNCIHADYDNDGWVDVLILRGAWLHDSGKTPNSLLKNMGDGTFQDRTKSSGMLSMHPTQTAAWSDFDRDGDLDLFIGNEGGPEEAHFCELFENQGDGTFKETAQNHGLGNIQEYVKGCGWGDVDNDGWPDLYLSVLGGQNRLYRNEKGQFVEVGQAAGVQEPYYSFPTWFCDVNNDGLVDLFACGYDLNDLNGVAGDFAAELLDKPPSSETPRLYINQGDFRFKDQTHAYGLDKVMYGMGANFGDLDNDGYLDFYVGTGAPDFSTVVPNRMFHNLGGQGFEEVTSAGNFGHIQKGHGVAFGDIDQDGDQDIYEVMGGAYEGDRFPNILYENPISKNHWLVVQLKGKVSNRSGIGCRIRIDLDNGKVIHRTVGTGGSFGASSLQQEVGLGDAQIKQLSVVWTTGEKQTFSKVEVNRKIEIVEGKKNFNVLPYAPIPFRKTPEKGHEHYH